MGLLLKAVLFGGKRSKKKAMKEKERKRDREDERKQ